jgi:Protein of unknown function (DUF1565)
MKYTYLLITFIFLPQLLFSKIYVDPSGVDAVGNGTQANPYRTILYAVTNSISNDTIGLNPGTYLEAADIYVTHPLTIITVVDR